jgi:DNA-binding transcriptional MerR regulator
MDISEVARRSGVPASALRYYEEKGLIASVGRDGLKRTFAPGVLDQLALIALGQSAGFTLEEIATMFRPDGRVSIDRAMLADKASEIDRTVRRLKAMSEGLKHAAVCPARNHSECPTFQRLLKAASGSRQGAAQKKTGPKAGSNRSLGALSVAPKRQKALRVMP